MISIVDVHCHLCSALDDGPRTLEEAVEMCRIAYADGTRWIAATAHQNDHYPDVTPERIRQAVQELTAALKAHNIPLVIRPTAEVMIQENTLDLLRAGKLMTVADQGLYILIEYPHGLFLDIRQLVRELRAANLRPILAHPERHPELLLDEGNIEELIELGCLVQMSASSITDVKRAPELRAIKSWLQRGVVHLIGSDGHSPGRRAPRCADAYRRIQDWAGWATADRICSTNGVAVLQGLPLHVARPDVRRRRWFSRLW